MSRRHLPQRVKSNNIHSNQTSILLAHSWRMRKERRQPSRTQKMQQFFHQLAAAPTTHSLNNLLVFITINPIMYAHQRVERSNIALIALMHRTSSTTTTVTATAVPTRSAPYLVMIWCFSRPPVQSISDLFQGACSQPEDSTCCKTPPPPSTFFPLKEVNASEKPSGCTDGTEHKIM